MLKKKRMKRRFTWDDEEDAIDVTAREGPFESDEGKGARVLVQRPCLTCHIPIFSNAAASKCLPELS